MITLSIPNISCGHCVRSITSAVQELDPAAVVQVDVNVRTATIDSAAELQALRDKLAAEGYPSTLL